MKYEIGIMRTLFGQNLMEAIKHAMSECSDLKEPYWIYFFNQPSMDGTVHRLVIRSLKKNQLRKVIPYVNGRPVPMLGTGLVKVDNQKGKAEWVWVLPRDVPHEELHDPFNECIEAVAAQAMALGLPIINA